MPLVDGQTIRLESAGGLFSLETDENAAFINFLVATVARPWLFENSRLIHALASVATFKDSSVGIAHK